jgi:hypothetical protein
MVRKFRDQWQDIGNSRSKDKKIKTEQETLETMKNNKQINMEIKQNKVFLIMINGKFINKI